METLFSVVQVDIRNFRSIIDASLPLDGELIILVGENAAGKTAILEALAIALSPLVDELAGRKRSGKGQRNFDFGNFTRMPSVDHYGRSKIIDNGRIDISIRGDVSWSCLYDVDLEKEPQAPKIVYEGFNEVENLADFFRLDAETLPIVAYYGIDRNSRFASRHTAKSKVSSVAGGGRRAGYVDALASKAVFSDIMEWFEAVESLELRQKRDLGDQYKDFRLNTIRRAVEQMIPEIRDLRMAGLPPRMFAEFMDPDGSWRSLALDQLSGGYLSIVALVIDLARRMVDVNPELPDPLGAPGLVMIDEIDLHLHPRWQQTVVSRLRGVFPNLQFILTTHSPQLLTSVEARCIRMLTWDDGHLTFERPPSINGAKSGRVLSEVMGVDERPPRDISPFVDALARYRALVAQDAWDRPEARQLVSRLEALSPDDPELHAIRLERRRLGVLRDRSVRS